MTDHTPKNWEPDPRKMGNWRAMFEPARRDGPTPEPPGPSSATPKSEPVYDDGAADDASNVDPTEYRPWILQRGRSRPAMMLHLRRFEPRSGLWQGWVMSYPSLQAVEYMGETMLSLDFGSRQFMIEGTGLHAITQQLQNGNVLAIMEFTTTIWGSNRLETAISSIKLLTHKGK